MTGLLCIDPKSNKVVATIRVGDYPNAIAAGMGAIWVEAQPGGGDAVQRIDPVSNRVTATVRVARGDVTLGSIAVGAGAVWVAVSEGEGPPWHPRIARLDPASGKVAAVIDASSVGDLYDLAASRNALWATGYNEDKAGDPGAVLRINPDTNHIAKRIPMALPRCITAGMGGVWVTSATNRGGTISRINPSLTRVIWTAQVGDDPCGITTGLGSVWATNSFKTADTSDPPVHNKVFQVDSRTGKVRASIGVSPGAGGGPSCPPCVPGPGGITVRSGSVWAITDWWNSKTKQTITRIKLTNRQ
jgi:hypothetical protein